MGTNNTKLQSELEDKHASLTTSFNERIGHIAGATTKLEARVRELEAINEELRAKLYLKDYYMIDLEEQLHNPIEYRIGHLYMLAKGTMVESSVTSELLQYAHGDVDPSGYGVQPNPLANGYLAIHYRSVNETDLNMIQNHAIIASDYIKQGVKNGNRHCQYVMGSFYLYGILDKPNMSRAIGLYHLASKQGHALAQFALASRYYLGSGVVQDFQEAFKWFKYSADQGFGMAQYWVGHCYEHGRGVNLDEDLSGDLAVEYYKKATDQGTVALKIVEEY